MNSLSRPIRKKERLTDVRNEHDDITRDSTNNKIIKVNIMTHLSNKLDKLK